MREFIVNENDANQRLDKFVLKTVKQMPKSLLYKSIRNKKIKVNRKRCEANQRLNVGDTIQMFLSEDLFDDAIAYDFLEATPLTSAEIVYEDEHIIILNKATGVLCHSESKADKDTLIQRLWHYLYQKGIYHPETSQSFRPALANRIDRNTQGLVLGAKDANGLRALNTIIKSRKIRKIYHCIIEGKLSKKQDTIILYHHKQEANNKAIMSEHPKEGYQKSETSYRVLKEKENYSLLEVELHSGKSHQIRAVFSYLKHPLLGDVKYGAKPHQYPHQALCSYQVQFLELTSPEVIALSYLSNQKIKLGVSEIDELFQQLNHRQK